MPRSTPATVTPIDTPSAFFAAIVDSFDELVVVVDPGHQVVAANRALVTRAGANDVADLIGQSLEGVFAAMPGAEVDAGSEVAARVARVPLHGELCWSAEDLELEIRAKRIEVARRSYIILFISDRGPAQRVDLLERTFVHDLINTISGLVGWSRLLEVNRDSAPQASARIAALTRRLLDQVSAQRALSADPAPHLVEREAVAPDQILAALDEVFAKHEATTGKRLELAARELVTIETNPTLLLRVLTNMVVNALEASAAGEVVRVEFLSRAGQPTFTVHNSAVIPETIAAQIFRRSCSTKSAARGLGTQSIKLLGERYLGGTVAVTSDEARGTTFSLVLPAGGPAADVSSVAAAPHAVGSIAR